MMNLVLVFSVLCITIGLITLIFILYYREQLISYTIEANIKKRQKRNSSQTWKVRLYEKLTLFPLIGYLISNIKTKISISKNLDEYSARNQAITMVFTSSVISFTTFLILTMLYGSNFYLLICILIGCIYLNSLILDSLINYGNKELLNELPDFINDIKHHYHITKMVDEAIYEASKRAKHSVSLQGMKIYEILTSSNPRKKLEDYYEKSPNKFLKILAGFSLLIKDFGDKKFNGVSLYVKNLNHIIEEINLEVIKQTQLAYWLKGLPIIILTPLIILPFIEIWMSKSFPTAKAFYESSTAFFLKNLIITIVVICFLLIKQIQKNESKHKNQKSADKILEYKLLNIFWIRNLINIIKPKHNTIRYKNLSKLLQDAGSTLNIEAVYLRKLYIGILTFIIITGLFYGSHIINIKTILSNPAYGIQKSNFYIMLGNLKGKEAIEQDIINKFDLEIINSISKIKHFIKLSKNKLKTVILNEIEKRGYSKEDINLVSGRILNKLTAITKEHLYLWEVVIAGGVAFILSNIPIWILLFQKTLRKADMQDEVFQFHTIIILLMHHKNVDVQTILQWMNQFSRAFREPITRCLNNIQNLHLALENLKQDVKYKEFVYIIDNLQIAGDKLDLKSAFDSLELEREFYKENRKELNKQLVNKKIEMGKIIGFIPFYASIILYLVFPIIFVSLTNMKQIINQLS